MNWPFVGMVDIFLNGRVWPFFEVTVRMADIFVERFSIILYRKCSGRISGSMGCGLTPLGFQ